MLGTIPWLSEAFCFEVPFLNLTLPDGKSSLLNLKPEDSTKLPLILLDMVDGAARGVH